MVWNQDFCAFKIVSKCTKNSQRPKLSSGARRIPAVLSSHCDIKQEIKQRNRGLEITFKIYNSENVKLNKKGIQLKKKNVSLTKEIHIQLLQSIMY